MAPLGSWQRTRTDPAEEAPGAPTGVNSSMRTEAIAKGRWRKERHADKERDEHEHNHRRTRGHAPGSGPENVRAARGLRGCRPGDIRVGPGNLYGAGLARLRRGGS